MSMSNLKKTKIDDKIIHTNKHDNEERRKRLVILKRRKGQNDKIKCGTNIKRKGFIFYRNFYFVLFLLVYIFQSFNECPFNHYCSYQEKKQHYRILADYHNISDTSTNKTNTLFEPSNVKKEEQKNKQTKNSGLSHMFSSEINKTQTNESNNKREISLTVKNQKNQTNKSKNNKKDKRNISISNKRNQSISSNNNNNNNKEEEEECTKNFTQYLHYFNSNFRENQNINTTPTNEFSEQQQQQQHHNDLKNKNKNNSEGHNYTHTNLPNNNNNNKVKGQQYNHQTENKNKNKIINYPRQDSQTNHYGRYTSRTNNQPRQDNQTNYYSRYTSRSNNPPRQDSQTSYYGRYTSRTNNQHRSENENDDESDYDDDEELQGHSVVYNDKIRKSNNRHESLHSYNIKETPKKNKKKSQRNNTNNNKTDNYDFNKHTSQQINSESNGSYGYNQQYNHSTQHELFIPQAHYTPYQQITPYGPSGQIVHYGPYIQNGNHIEPVPYVVTSSGELMVPQYNANGAYVAVPVDAITQQQINLYIDSTVQRRELQMRNVYTQELVQYKRELDLEHQYKKKTLKFQQLLINAAMLSLLIGSICLLFL
ncbi:hypothetical protein CYL21_3564 [Plasmodium falciparum NF54]|uniref:Uncharacterized protein n=2 Tax=Plasmodium falciparum TaxID=5833 RepID=B9ZSJ1_PLAF7|nr:Plasmodium exported protein, unknown function [Plasmodium falciparum 3D7]EWC91160.1 hypothetical protein PFNF54_00125 [Plasmodium falciparum NF54]KAF4328344.1 hypothetical protein CYL21_3564 [Plasmodium falciparum NF54]PKC48057.1 hypothetical protein CK202_2162 [Plasmodium falciparum NF54]CAX51195.1 Plasmodium exported protein, unknown function [Plasmodium falciparum 3D7]|eukprot:XP_002808613.1 Plasmodium exported protein, unknown function [Plasmodium falciparum 3D7]